MRGGALLLTLAALAGCEQASEPLYTADCNDGSRISGTKAVVESRCSRLRGMRSLIPMNEIKEPAAAP